MVHSPSKYTALNRLRQIKQDNYVGETGKEYAQCEVDLMIVEKMQAQAEKLSRFDMFSHKHSQWTPEVELTSKPSVVAQNIIAEFLSSESVLKEFRASIIESNNFGLGLNH